ncbi:MAG: DUF971 domain-containing protein [Gammaproteobacteria bacterium]
MLPRALSNLRASATLTVEWPDGQVQQLSNQLLRARCRCTECESARRKGVPVQPGAVVVEQINPIGSYAVQFVFSDGHERGIYPWEYLRGLESVAQA